jgi:hypothetical protein
LEEFTLQIQTPGYDLTRFQISTHPTVSTAYDNISYTVPEPAALSYLLMAGGGIARRWRRTQRGGGTAFSQGDPARTKKIKRSSDIPTIAWPMPRQFGARLRCRDPEPNAHCAVQYQPGLQKIIRIDHLLLAFAAGAH